MQAIETREVNGFTVAIHYHEDASSPRDDDSPGCGLVLSRRGYNLPNDAGINFDDFGGWDEIAAHLTSEHGALLVLPVYAMIHSGIALSLGAYGDPWDSGTLGVAYVTPQIWEETQGRPWTGSEADREMARNLIKGDVEVYGMYLNGEVYGYTVTDPIDGEEVNACWGFYGFESAEEAANESAASFTHEPKCTGTLNHRTGQVEHAGACPLHPAAHDAGWQHGCDDSPIPTD